MWPDANVGVATGDGLVVLDVDPRHNGDATLDVLEEEHGEIITLTSRTGGGGLHMFLDGELPARNGFLPGLDLKADGGLVVAVPSLHTSGRKYEWIDPNDDLREVPPWLRELLTKASSNGTGSAARVGHAIPNGERDSTLTSLASSMRRRGMQEPAILAALVETNRLQCRPPLSEEQVEKIAKSIGNKPAEPLGRPVYEGPATPLAETLAVFRKWLHLTNETPVLTVLGVVAANRLAGDPVWLGLVAPPSSCKTEILNSLGLLADVRAVA